MSVIVAACHCDACGRDSQVESASAWLDCDAEGNRVLRGVFGSAADFCNYCDEPYEGEHTYSVKG